MEILPIEKKINSVVSMQLRTEAKSCCSGSQVVLGLHGLHNCLLPLQNCLKEQMKKLKKNYRNII